MITHNSHIDLKNILNITRGDSSRLLKYLEQFRNLIPERLEKLRIAVTDCNRMQIRQILHKMSPQLQFFGITDIIVPIQRLEFEYEHMPFEELTALVNDIIIKLELAVKDVNMIIDRTIENPDQH